MSSKVIKTYSFLKYAINLPLFIFTHVPFYVQGPVGGIGILSVESNRRDASTVDERLFIVATSISAFFKSLESLIFDSQAQTL